MVLVLLLNFDTKRGWRACVHVTWSHIVSLGLASVVLTDERNVFRGWFVALMLIRRNECQHRIVTIGIWTGREFEVPIKLGENSLLIYAGICAIELQNAVAVLLVKYNGEAHPLDWKDGWCFSTQSASSQTTVHKFTWNHYFCLLPCPDFRSLIVNYRLDLHLMSLCSESWCVTKFYLFN